jgi:ferredoxin
MGDPSTSSGQVDENKSQDSSLNTSQQPTSQDASEKPAEQEQAEGGGLKESDDGKMRTKTSDKAKYVIKVDVPGCIGAASCVAICPKVFALDDQQKAVILDPAGDTPENILMAAQSCPTKAVILEDRESGKQVWPEA